MALLVEWYKWKKYDEFTKSLQKASEAILRAQEHNERVQDLLEENSSQEASEELLEPMEVPTLPEFSPFAPLSAEQIVPDLYKEARKAEYPDIGEQLDMIYHDIDTWKAKIQEIKEKHPKV